MVPDVLVQKKIFLTERESEQLAVVCKARGEKISPFVRDCIRERLLGISTLDGIQKSIEHINVLRNAFEDDVAAFRAQAMEDARQQRLTLQLLIDNLQELTVAQTQNGERQASELKRWTEQLIQSLAEDQAAKFKDMRDLNINSIQLIAAQINGETSKPATMIKPEKTISTPRGNLDVFRNQAKPKE